MVARRAGGAEDETGRSGRREERAERVARREGQRRACRPDVRDGEIWGDVYLAPGGRTAQKALRARRGEAQTSATAWTAPPAACSAATSECAVTSALGESGVRAGGGGKRRGGGKREGSCVCDEGREERAASHLRVRVDAADGGLRRLRLRGRVSDVSWTCPARRRLGGARRLGLLCQAGALAAEGVVVRELVHTPAWHAHDASLACPEPSRDAALCRAQHVRELRARGDSPQQRREAGGAQRAVRRLRRVGDGSRSCRGQSCVGSQRAGGCQHGPQPLSTLGLAVEAARLEGRVADVSRTCRGRVAAEGGRRSIIYT